MSVIKEAGCGFCVPAGDVDGSKEAIIEFAKNKQKHKEYGENARNYFLENFRKDIHVKAIEKELRSCLGE